MPAIPLGEEGRPTAAGFRRLVWDNHACPPQNPTAEALACLERYRAAGVTVLGLNIGDSEWTFAQIQTQANMLRNYIIDNSDKYNIIERIGDVDTYSDHILLHVFFNIEGCFSIGDELSRLDRLHRLGVRWMSLVYNRGNAVGGGVHDDHDPGLTPFGARVISRMKQLGVIPCLSHTGYRTARDALALAAGPCIFSHSNPRALCDHPRNIPDDLIRLCADGGGVVGINGLSIFLGADLASTERVLAHVDYVVQLVGSAEHVGLGLDYVFDQADMDRQLAAGAHTWPTEWGYRPGIKFVQPEQWPQIVEGLFGLGYDEAAVRAVLGQNFRRVAAQAWR